MRFGRKAYEPLNRVLIDGSALRNNLALFRQKLPKLEIAPVLKSNAYGHGLREIAGLLKTENCPFYVVDSAYEAYEIRTVDKKIPILILGYHLENNFRKKKNVHYTAGSLEQLDLLSRHKVPIHIELNTGMNRMGFSWHDPERWMDAVVSHKDLIVGLFTHLADADNPRDSDTTDLQVKRFETLLEQLKERDVKPHWIHVGNSAGSLKLKNHPFTLARVGFSLYGMNVYDDRDSFHGELDGLHPVLEFQSTLVQIQNLEAGDGVSYGLQFKAEKPMRIGVLCAGYYEGIPLSLSKVGYVEIRGKTCPIRGRVCMNHTLVELPDDTIQVGDRVTIYSKHTESKCGVLKQAAAAKTIPYELLVRISESVRREIS